MEQIRPTYIITILAFVIVLFYVIANKKTSSDNVQTIQFLEANILFIAFLSYVVIYFIKDEKRSQKWRYLDWIITTPLLLGTFYLLAVEKGYEQSIIPAIIANVLMILFGYWAEYPETSPLYGEYHDSEIKNLFYILSFLSLIIVLYYVYEWDRYLQNNGVDTKLLPYFFYIGWTLYGVIFLLEDGYLRQSAFDLLDLFNKPIYTLYLTNIMENNNFF